MTDFEKHVIRETIKNAFLAGYVAGRRPENITTEEIRRLLEQCNLVKIAVDITGAKYREYTTPARIWAKATMVLESLLA